MMNAAYRQLARRQLSEKLTLYAATAPVRPRDGWIAALRDALDMTVRQFAARLGVAPSSVVRLEQRERDDTISLGALRRAANALNCDLVYAVVPRVTVPTHGANTMLDSVIAERAHRVATEEIRYVAQLMSLEDQAVHGADLEAQVNERATALTATPRRLWDTVTEAPQCHK